MEENIVVFENVTKRYGEKTALSDISFSVKRGEFFGFLGPNGAGKTTSIKSMIGLIQPEKGRVLVDGYDVSKDPVRVRSMIGFVPDSPFVYGKLTAREFLRFVGGLYNMEKSDLENRIEWLCDLFDMHGWLDRRTEEYSHGMKQKVVMSAAFIHRPELTIVDEPTVGLDPPSSRLLKDLLLLMQEQGTTIFMSSHDLAVVQELCGQMVILHQGGIVAEGSLEELRTKAKMDGGNLEDLFLKLTGRKSKTAYLD